MAVPNMLIEKVDKVLNEIRKTDEIGSVLVGLSGGADSTALFTVLCRLSEKYGFKVYAAHVNHCLRGDAADRDEEFSRRLAEEHGAGFFSLRADVAAIAEERGISEEEAGRNVRYSFFDRTADENGIDFIATAHHKNDNAETILMNFMRGSGVSGLCGIPYRRGRLIRPLLDVSRAEIERFCAEEGIGYVTDATNFEECCTRNRIRGTLIPYIEKTFNPSFVETVTANAAVIKRDEDLLDAETERLYGELVKDGEVSAEAVNALHPSLRLRLIRKMIGAVNGTSDISAHAALLVEDLCAGARTGSGIDIYGGIRASVSYGRLRIARRGADGGDTGDFCYRLVVGKEVYVPELGMNLHAAPATERGADGEYFSVPSRGADALADAVIEIRNRRPGDKFVPWGMSGTKKLKDFMIDEKIPRGERGSVGILTIDGDIAWIIGHRRDGRFKFQDSGIKIWITY